MVFSNDFFRFGLDNDETFFQGRDTLTKRGHTRVEYRPEPGLVRFSKTCRVRGLQLFVSHRGTTTSDTTFFRLAGPERGFRRASVSTRAAAAPAS
jgi:hypothetical protein